MRRLIHIIAFTLLLFAAACSEKRPVYTLSGTTPEGGDTLYLYGLDRRYDRMDTIIADANGQYGHSIVCDTLFPASLLMPDGKPVLLYVEPDAVATIERDSLGRYSVESSGTLQQLYDSMAAHLNSLPPYKHFAEIEKFVESNPLNEVSIMLWRRYLVEIYKPSRRDIHSIMNKFGGRLLDNDYVIDYKERNDDNRSRTGVLYSSMPAFEFTTIDSTKITNAAYKEDFLVLTFWASWDSLSLNHLKNVTAIDTLYKKKTKKEKKDKKEVEIKFLNISLDCDTAAWKAAVCKDSIPGDNVCDGKMWDNPLVKRYDIGRIPYSVIVNPQLLNVRYNISPDGLAHTMDSLVNDHKEKLKAKEKESKKKKSSKRK